jgi:hypothetical protein
MSQNNAYMKRNKDMYNDFFENVKLPNIYHDQSLIIDFVIPFSFHPCHHNCTLLIFCHKWVHS